MTCRVNKNVFTTGYDLFNHGQMNKIYYHFQCECDIPLQVEELL